MKKVVIVISLLMILLMGCSNATDEVWPKEIKGKDFLATRADTEYSGANGSMEMSYIYLSEEDIITGSSLIARINISEDPVEYNIDHIYDGKEVSKPMMAYIGVIQKVYFTDANVKDGDTVKFLRQEFVQTKNESEVIRMYNSETIKFNKGEYILFLEDYTRLKEEIKVHTEKYGPTNRYDAFKTVAPYYSADPCRKVIVCPGDNVYIFDSVFTSLMQDAIKSDVGYGFAMYEKQDENFDKTLTDCINKYRTIQGE